MAENILYNERQLLDAVANGDETAFAELFNSYHNKLYGFILKLTKNEEAAEDVVQDVFLKIWMNRATLVAIDHFNAYLFRMSQNHALNGLKRMANEIQILTKLAKSGKEGATMPDEQLLQKEVNEQLQQAINQLPAQQKKVYTMSRMQGMKYEEIAEALNLSVSTVKNHMATALHNIRKAMTNSYPETGIYFILLLSCLSRESL